MTDFYTKDHYLTESDRALREDRWDEQLSLMQRATQQFPRNAEFAYRLAVANATSAPTEARVHATRAVELAPADPLIVGRCASLMYDVAEYDLAESYVRKTIPIAGDDFPLLADMLHLIGKLAVRKENDEIAEQYLSLGFESEPGSLGHADFLATLFVKQGRLDEASAVVARGLAARAPDHDRLVAIRQLIDTARRHETEAGQ
jgi:tetratricopeptide (TPR) repeat protein